jgi:hypothetical protein
VPSEITSALSGLGSMMGQSPGIPDHTDGPKKRRASSGEGTHQLERSREAQQAEIEAQNEVAKALEDAKRASQPGAM